MSNIETLLQIRDNYYFGSWKEMIKDFNRRIKDTKIPEIKERLKKDISIIKEFLHKIKNEA